MAGLLRRHERNVGTLKIGDEIVLETRYQRLRIDPSTFQLDLSDTRFATSTGTRHNLPPE